MMTRFILSLLVVFYGGQALGCELHLPPRLVILGEPVNLVQAGTHTECSEEALKEINKTLSGVEGKITNFQLAGMMKAKKHDVIIQPGLIQIQHLKNIVREHLMIPPGVQLRSSEAIDAPNYLALQNGDNVELECVGCLFGTQQPLNVNIRGFDGVNRSLAIRANFKKMVKAYRLMSSGPAFSEITSNSLKEEYVEAIPHTDLVTNLETLKFYKINKPLKAGELLRQSDLNALNLVKAGLKTEVVIENELIRLKTSGISRSNGTLGEFVEVFHPQKNKKYLGKVIDINKVLVEL